MRRESGVGILFFFTFVKADEGEMGVGIAAKVYITPLHGTLNESIPYASPSTIHSFSIW
jgi:hypothetical protein